MFQGVWLCPWERMRTFHIPFALLSYLSSVCLFFTIFFLFACSFRSFFCLLALRDLSSACSLRSFCSTCWYVSCLFPRITALCVWRPRAPGPPPPSASARRGWSDRRGSCPGSWTCLRWSPLGPCQASCDLCPLPPAAWWTLRTETENDKDHVNKGFHVSDDRVHSQERVSDVICPLIGWLE